MRLILRSPPPGGSSSMRVAGGDLHAAPNLGVCWSSPWQEFGGNLRAVLDTARPVIGYWRDIFPDLFLRPWRPRRSLAASGIFHTAVLLLVWNLTPFWHLFRPPAKAEEQLGRSQRITWYKFADELPAISPEKGGGQKRSERGGRRRGPSPRGATVFHPQQVIISNPPRPDNAQQTIYQPDTPNIRITRDVRLPNIVMWRELEKPLPPVDLVKRDVAKLTLPASLTARNVDLPQDVPNLERRVSDLKVAASNSVFPNARLPVAPATPAAGNAPANPELPPPPAPSAVTGAGGSSQLRRLIAIGVNPAPPGGPIDVPPGNRFGSFSVAPAGKTPGTPHGSLAGLQGAGAIGPAPAGEGSGEGNGVGGGSGVREIAEIRVPGLSVIGGVAKPGPVPVVMGPPAAKPPAAPRPAMPSPLQGASRPEGRPTLVARSTRPQLPGWGRGEPQAERGFLPGKKVYTLYINMPNLSSAAGSWILRFAELADRGPGGEEDKLAAPSVLRKVDPGYEPSAIRDRVEGLLILHAVIRKDGRVERIEVLRSLDPRLDERAIQALGRWEFAPATRDGIPVDLEAVIQIPFALPRAF